MQRQRQDYIYVFIQFVLFGLFLLEVDRLRLVLPSWIQLNGIPMGIAGLTICGIAVLQLNRNLSPFPSPTTGSTLITNGVFTWIRHPIYTGIIMGLLGASLYYQSLYKIIIIAVLAGLFYFKTSYEEERLAAVFTEYEAYKAKTKRFIPFVL